MGAVPYIYIYVCVCVLLKTYIYDMRACAHVIKDDGETGTGIWQILPQNSFRGRRPKQPKNGSSVVRDVLSQVLPEVSGGVSLFAPTGAGFRAKEHLGHRIFVYDDQNFLLRAKAACAWAGVKV